MAYTPQPIPDGEYTSSLLNSELTAIAFDLADKLSKTGDGANMMQADLNMGGNRVINSAASTGNGDELITRAEAEALIAESQT